MYIIMAKFRAKPWEEVDSADSFQEAMYLLNEYIIAFGAGWTLKSVRKDG